jgi:hypothetical protein
LTPPSRGQCRLALRVLTFYDMGTHISLRICTVMKTTIEISDPLLREARELAEREGVTLRAVVERGLRRVMTETKPGPPFKLRRASFKGKGLQAEARGSWGRQRDLAYEGRGG